MKAAGPTLWDLAETTPDPFAARLDAQPPLASDVDGLAWHRLGWWTRGLAKRQRRRNDIDDKETP